MNKIYWVHLWKMSIDIILGTVYNNLINKRNNQHQTQTEVQAMKNLTIKYSRKDFFGNRIYTEDTKENFTKADLTKAFLFLSKNNDAAVQVDSMVIYWDTFSEFENKTVSVRMYSAGGYTAGKTPFDVIKKNFYAKLRDTGRAA